MLIELITVQLSLSSDLIFLYNLSTDTDYNWISFIPRLLVITYTEFTQTVDVEIEALNYAVSSFLIAILNKGINYTIRGPTFAHDLYGGNL